jgi:hypothetical protein
MRPHTEPHPASLAAHLTPAQLVAAYQHAEREIRQGFALIRNAVDRLNHAYTDGNAHGVSIQSHAEYVRWEDPGVHITIMRRQLWRIMVEKLELRRFMSVKAWDDLCREIEKGECPEITSESVSAMVRQFSGRAPEMLKEAVEEVFSFLRPPGSHYKRNSEFEVPRRIALTWIIDTWHAKTFASKFLRPRHEVEQNLTALENVFSSLDGQGSTTKGHLSTLSETIRQTKRGELGETEYFAFRGYANGSLHLEFKRLDLLKRLNAIAGGKRLHEKGAA